MMIRREAFVESSQCSSGCQSGWTLYLDHSNGHSHQHCCSSLPYKPAQRQMLQQAESDEEDSMVSDASSGPPTQPREEEKLQGHKLPQCHFGYHCYSSSGHRSTSGPSSGWFGSTWTHSLDEAKSKKRRAAIQGEEAVRRHDDDLDDTAISSAVFSCPMINEHAPIDVVEAMHGGGDLTDLPTCALSARQFAEWPAMESTNMQQGYGVMQCYTVTD